MLGAAPQLRRSPRLHEGAGRSIQLVALLARLGMGTSVIRGEDSAQACSKTSPGELLALSKDIGCRALLIQADSGDARDFYRHLVPEFEDSPTDSLHLALLMKDSRRTLTR